MTNTLIPNFNPGGFIDREDKRDFMWQELGGATSTQFDWVKGFDVEKELAIRLNIPNFKLTVKDQGVSFSCGGQSWSYLAEVLEALNTGTYEPRSAKYLYSQTCVPSGGSRGRDNADIFVNQGVSKEDTLTSYENNSPPSEKFMQRSKDITDFARQDAKLSKASAYAQTGVDIESVATAIQKNHGVVLGVDGQNGHQWQSAHPTPPNQVIWRHWIAAFRAISITPTEYQGWKDGIIDYQDLKQKYAF